MFKKYESQIPDVIPDEDEIYIMDDSGKLKKLEVPDDESDD